jgi:hypothetical protein
MTTMTKTIFRRKVHLLSTVISNGEDRHPAKRRFAQASMYYLYCLVAFTADVNNDWEKLPAAIPKHLPLRGLLDLMAKLLVSIGDPYVEIGDGFSGHDYREFLLRELYGVPVSRAELRKLRALLGLSTERLTKRNIEKAYARRKRGSQDDPELDRAYQVLTHWKKSRNNLDQQARRYSSIVSCILQDDRL